MNVQALDQHRGLWQVVDLLSEDQCQDILSIDWLSLPWSRSLGQETWPRRLIDREHPDVQRASGYINSRLSEINQQLGTDYKNFGGNWWLDEPGFTVDMHTDGEVPATMQIYWTVPGPEYGTCFYHYNQKDAIKYHFQSIPNSGYIMLNHADESGYRILQWHGMSNPVPPGTWRLSSYWYFS